MRPFLRPPRGQGLVEFTVMVVLLLLLVSAIIDVGRALTYYYLLNDAAEEGALYGSVCPVPDYVSNRAKKSLNTFRAPDIEVTVICSPTTDCNTSTAGESVQVTVKYTMNFLTPLGWMVFPDRHGYTIKVSKSHLILTDPPRRAFVCTP